MTESNDFLGKLAELDDLVKKHHHLDKKDKEEFKRLNEKLVKVSNRLPEVPSESKVFYYLVVWFLFLTALVSLGGFIALDILGHSASALAAIASSAVTALGALFMNHRKGS